MNVSHNKLYLVVWTVVSVSSVLHRVTSTCMFGNTPGCTFPCHCDGDDSCGSSDGVCPGRCQSAPSPMEPWSGPKCQTGNLALHKPAEQSANSNPDGASIQHPANNSVDGDTNAALSAGSCSHPTAVSVQRSWWRVDLLKDYIIERVIVHNRDSREYRARLNHTDIIVSSTLDGNELCGTIVESNFIILSELSCHQKMLGRYVKLRQQRGGESMNFCEVEVIGYTYHRCQGRYYGPGCQTSCNCDQECDKVTGYCGGTCDPGKAKPDCQESCDIGQWGPDCRWTCGGCVEGAQFCSPTDGACPSVCLDGYTRPQCDWKIPSLQDANISVTDVNGREAHVEFTAFDSSTMFGDGFVSSYLVEYNDDLSVSSWRHLHTITVTDQQYTIREKVLLPEVGQQYQLRVNCTQNVAQYTGSCYAPTRAVDVYTKCSDGAFGVDCTQRCMCRDPEEVCDKVTGNCSSGCPETHYGPDCQYRIPFIESEPEFEFMNDKLHVLVVYRESGKENITVFLQTKLWTNATEKESAWLDTELIADGRDRSASVSTLFTLSRNELKINKYYDMRVKLYVDGDIYSGYSVPSATSKVFTACDNRESGKYCANWCNCAEGMCLKPSVECTNIPITTDLNGTVEQIGTTYVRVRIDGDSVNGALPVHAYKSNSSLLPHRHGDFPHVVDVNNLKPSTMYNIEIVAYVQHNYREHPVAHIIIKKVLTILAKQGSSYTMAVVYTMSCIAAIIVLAAVLLVFLYIRRSRNIRHKKTRNLSETSGQHTYQNMCDLSDIDQTLDVSLEEKLKRASRFPDLLGMLSASDDHEDHTPLRKTSSFNNIYTINQNQPLHSNSESPQLPPRNKTGALARLSRDELLQRRGSDTKLHYHSKAPVTDNSQDEVLDYNSLEGIPISVDDLKKTIEMLDDKKSAYNGFSKEFARVPNNSAAPMQVSVLKANKPKNRFIDIRPYDHSRVVLDAIDDDVFSDYINASYIDGYKNEQKVYIASQAPKENTVPDMWRMIWQNNINVVVMLTNVIESGRRKSELYWPRQRSEKYGQIEVTLMAAEGFAFHVQRKFLLRNGKITRHLHHLQFTGWPDHGVPDVYHELLDFYYKVMTFDKQRTGPWLLHCSAGIGRTGSFIAIDYLLKQARDVDYVDVFKCVSHMRLNRHQMVQTEHQYRFIYEAVLEALTQGNTAIPVRQFTEEAAENLINSPAIQELIKGRQRHTEPELEYIGRDGMKPDQKSRNRDTAPIPPDSGRPHLITVGDQTDYINAVFVDSYVKKNAFIATQLPLPGTQPEFWRMICEYHCSSIVMLCDVTQQDLYWPLENNQSLQFGPITVKLKNAKRLLDGKVVQREFEVSNESTPDLHKNLVVSQWHVIGWPCGDETSKLSADLLLSVNEHVDKWQKDRHCKAPVVVQCLDGVNRSDLYVTLRYVLQKMSADGVVDIPFAIRQVRKYRPQFMLSLEHVKHICAVVQTLNSDSHADYANEW